MNDAIQEIAKDSGSISGTMIVLMIFCGIWAFERIYKLTKHQKNGVPSWGELNQKLDTKVNNNECNSFKVRIGKESDEHRTNIVKINDKLGAIHGDVQYIKGKIGNGT